MRYVAFLRGMNVGGRRITNDELCGCFEELGFTNVWAFLASGNVTFETPGRSRARVSQRVEQGLAKALEYEVPTFLRTAQEISAVSRTTPFAESQGANGGKLQVAFLARKPDVTRRRKALSLSTEADQLAIEGQELYWLPVGKITDSELDFAAIERALGSYTVRTHRTVLRLSQKLAP